MQDRSSPEMTKVRHRKNGSKHYKYYFSVQCISCYCNIILITLLIFMLCSLYDWKSAHFLKHIFSTNNQKNLKDESLSTDPTASLTKECTVPSMDSESNHFTLDGVWDIEHHEDNSHLGQCVSEFKVKVKFVKSNEANCHEIVGTVKTIKPYHTLTNRPIDINTRKYVFHHMNRLLGNIYDSELIPININISSLRNKSDTFSVDNTHCWEDSVIRGMLEDVSAVPPYKFNSLREQNGANIAFPSALLLLYLANCIPRSIDEFSLQKLIDIKYCIFSDRSVILIKNSGEKTMKKNLETALFKRRNLCKINKSLMRKLRSMDSVTSSVPSLGSNILKAMTSDDVTYAHDTENEASSLGRFIEELDGRVSTFLSRYDSVCSRTDQNVFMKHDNLKFYEHSPIISMKLHDAKCECYMWATFSDSRRGFVKMFGYDIDRSSQGFGELAAYYLDRLIGLNRYPVVAMRRIYMNTTVQPVSLLDPENNFQKIMDVTHKTYFYLLNKMRPDVTKNKYYITVSVIAEVVKGLTEVENVRGSDLADIFLHKALPVAENNRFTLQLLRDTVDIVVLDFLCHNVDRPVSRNWFKVERRLVPFDNGASFWPSITSSICSILLHCPTCICPLHMNSKNTTLCNIKKSTAILSDGFSKACLFRKYTIDRVRYFVNNTLSSKNGLGDSLCRLLLRNGASPEDLHRSRDGLQKLCSEVDLRAKFLLDYVNSCFIRYGESIFV